MSPLDRFLIAAMAAAVAWFFAAAVNVPVWRAWVPGDRIDIALLVFLIAVIATRQAAA